MVQNKQGSSLCSVPHHNESVLPMTQNESDGEGKITAQNCSWRNKGQPVILRKKPALPIIVTQELVAQAPTFFEEQVEHTASFSSRGNQNFLLFKHTLEKSIIYLCSPQLCCIKSRDTSKTCSSHLSFILPESSPLCTRSLLCIHRHIHTLKYKMHMCCICVCVCFHFKILERVSSSGFTPTSLFIISNRNTGSSSPGTASKFA